MSFLNQNKKSPPLNPISSFRDESGVSTRRLDIGLWFLHQRKHFVIAIIIILSLVSIITISYSVYHLSYYLIVGQQQDEQLYKELGSNAGLVIKKNFSGNYLSSSEVAVLLNQSNQADIVGTVTNTNPRSVINFSYYFNVGGEKVGAGSNFIFPGDSKYVMALNQKIPSIQANAEMVIENISFTAVDRQALSRWSEYRNEHLNFLVEDAVFIPGQDSGLSEKLSLGELHFKITNSSGYSYKEVPLAIVLRNGERIVSVSRYYLKNFRSGEARSTRISWPGSWSGISQIEIVPDLNILDESVYLQYSSE